MFEMSHFKKDLQEHYNFFAMCFEYRLAQHNRSNENRLRFASATDLLTFNAFEKIILAETDESLNERFAAVGDDIMRVIRNLKREYRGDFGLEPGSRFQELKEQRRENKDTNFAENLRAKRAEFGTSTKPDLVNLRNVLIQKLIPSITGTIINQAKNAGRTINAEKARDLALDAILTFMGASSGEASNEAGFVDYLVDLPLRMDSTIDDVAKLLNRAVVGGIGRTQSSKLQKEEGATVSTEETLKGGKADTADVTVGEGIEEGGPSMEEQVIEEIGPKTDFIRKLIVRMNLSAALPALDAVDANLDLKKNLFDKRFLSDEEMSQYISADERINDGLNKISTAILNRIPEGQTKNTISAALTDVLEKVQDSFNIPGFKAPAALQEEEVPTPAPAAPGVAPKPKRRLDTDVNAYVQFMEQGNQHFQDLLPHIYGSMAMHPAGSEMAEAKQSTPRLLRKRVDSIPYGEGIETSAQEQAVISGDDEAMIAAGVPAMARFNRDLLQIVHEWQLNKMWESQGQALVDATGKKDANDVFNAKLEALKEEYKDYPDVIARISQYIRPKGQAGGGLYQQTFIDFDKVRINGEFTKVLSDLGLKSFGELSMDDPRIESALDKIVSEESHFGQGTGWLGTKGVQHNFDPASFKSQLRAYLNFLIQSSGYEGPKNLPWWKETDAAAHGLQPANATMRGRQKAAPSPAAQAEGTQLGVQDDQEVKTSTFRNYTSPMDDDNDDLTEFFAHKTTHKHPQKVRRFKIVVK
jgi:hypothetical protein